MAGIPLTERARPYKVYTALLTQTGTNAPVATVLENTLGGTVVWSYVFLGSYRATLSNAFTFNKTFVNIQNTGGGAFGANIVGTLSINTIDIYSFDVYGGDIANDLLNKTSIEIRVYP